MSKKKAHQQQKINQRQRKHHHRRKSLLIAGLILCLGLTSMIMAQLRATRMAGRTNAMLASSALLPTPTPSPLTLSKEYIYAGGRLIATEEPQAAAASSTPTPTPNGRSNVALASNGGVATASSQLSGYAPAGANNGDRLGLNWGTSGGWADDTANTFPDWLQIQFNGQKSIDEIDIYTVQDNYSNPGIPDEQMTFSSYGVTSFDVQYWNGSAWVSLPGWSVSGNNHVWNKFIFTPLITDMIRVSVSNSPTGYSCITEVEAYGVAAPSLTNFALSSNGGVASASSEYVGGGYAASKANNGDRKGQGPGGSVDYWNSGTVNTFPDWLQVDFSGQKTLRRIELFMLQDTYWAPNVPDPDMTFLYYGLRDFEVQYWNGTAWLPVPGGNVTNNNKVWRTFTFPDILTSKIRVSITGTPDGWSRLTELEAWGN